MDTASHAEVVPHRIFKILFGHVLFCLHTFYHSHSFCSLVTFCNVTALPHKYCICSLPLPQIRSPGDLQLPEREHLSGIEALSTWGLTWDLYNFGAAWKPSPSKLKSHSEHMKCLNMLSDILPIHLGRVLLGAKALGESMPDLTLGSTSGGAGDIMAFPFLPTCSGRLVSQCALRKYLQLPFLFGVAWCGRGSTPCGGQENSSDLPSAGDFKTDQNTEFARTSPGNCSVSRMPMRAEKADGPLVWASLEQQFAQLSCSGKLCGKPQAQSWPRRAESA